MYQSVIPKARGPSGRKRLILEKLFQGCCSLCYCHLVPMTHSLIKSLHGPQYMTFYIALCRMHWPRGNLFGQCLSAFIYSAFSAITSGATEVAHLNKQSGSLSWHQPGRPDTHCATKHTL